MRSLLLITLLFCSGCATATISTATPDGKTCEATYFSIFKDITSPEMNACGAHGSATNSVANTALLEAFLQVLASVPK
jgi:hypothetical protein